MTALAARGLVAVRLRAGAVYVSPLGLLCCWVPPNGDERSRTTYQVFEYIHSVDGRHGARCLWRDGFFLSQANLHLLREVFE